MPRVSIVIPVFNTQDYLAACLQSVADQRFDDFEAIVVDDKSTDNSREIVKRFARHDPRIRLIAHSENKHAGGARNTGIRAASSNYILLLDSDDCIDSDALACLYEATDKEFFDVVAFGFRTVDLSGKVLSNQIPAPRDVLDGSKLKGRLLMTQPAPWNKLWRRTLFTEDGLWFPESMYWEDLATVSRLMLKAKTIRFLSKSLYAYLERPGSHVHTISARHIVDYMRVFDVIRDFLINEGLYEDERADFEALVRYNFAWYAQKILSTPGMDGAKEASIRYCALIATAYLVHSDAYAKNTPAQNIKLIEAIQSAAPAPVQGGSMMRRFKGLLPSGHRSLTK